MTETRKTAPGVRRLSLLVVLLALSLSSATGAAVEPRSAQALSAPAADCIGWRTAACLLGGVALLQTVALAFLWQGLRRHKETERLLRQEQLQREATDRILEERAREEAAQNREKERHLLQQSRFIAMGEMIGNIAHQWRQPLNMLGLLIQQMQMEQEKGVMTDRLMEERVGKGMELLLQLSRTIDEFRSFFRPAGEAAPFSLAQVVQSTVRFFEPSCLNHNIRIAIQGKSEVTLVGHADQFSQALLSILNNARDALVERGTTQPLITVAMHDEEKRSVLTVTDNGGGIDERIIDMIFDPYFTTKEEGKGTGVGLYMARSIINRNMRGELSAANVAGGAEFKIVIQETAA